MQSRDHNFMPLDYYHFRTKMPIRLSLLTLSQTIPESGCDRQMSGTVPNCKRDLSPDVYCILFASREGFGKILSQRIGIQILHGPLSKGNIRARKRVGKGNAWFQSEPVEKDACVRSLNPAFINKSS